MAKFLPEIVIKQYCLEGYPWVDGAPEQWEVKAVFENVLLEQATGYGEMVAGARAIEFKNRWSRDWVTAEAFQAAIKDKPAASPLCDGCGRNTLDGIIYCVNKTFCKTCEKNGTLEGAKSAYMEAATEYHMRMQRENAAKREKEESYAAECATGRQLKFDGNRSLFFKRLEDGRVRMSKMHKDILSGRYVLSEEWFIEAKTWSLLYADLDNPVNSNVNN